MTDIHISKLNEAYTRIEAGRSICEELNDYFAFFVPNYQFMPKFKNKMWDGKIRLFNTRNNTIPLGLIGYMDQFAKERDYTIEFGDNVVYECPYTREQLRKYFESLEIANNDGEKIEPYDYQIEAAIECVYKGRRTVVSPTSSGKSLVIYMICRYFMEEMQEDTKILLIVPTIALVGQMANDMDCYAKLEYDDFRKNFIHEITGGKEKHSNALITISTWQSIYKMGREYFSQFNVLFGDEAHEYEGKAVQGIMEKAINASFRFGFTGTLREAKANKLQIESAFGRAYQTISVDELMRRKQVANLQVVSHVLDYGEDSERTKSILKLKYADEKKFITTLSDRNSYIAKIVEAACKSNHNSLVLVEYVDHVKELKKLFEEREIPVYIVHGSTNADVRNEIRSYAEENNGIVIVATYGTFQRGVSIRNIRHLVLASPTKSFVRLVQSIGRALRKSKTKEKAYLHDIVDLIQRKSGKSIITKHAEERNKIYLSQKYPLPLKYITRRFYD